MQWNLSRQIERIEYQCLAICFLAAGQWIFAVRPPKSTARQVRKKSCFFNNVGTGQPSDRRFRMASNSRLPRMLYIVLVGFTSTKNGFMRSGVWQCGQSRSSAGSE